MGMRTPSLGNLAGAVVTGIGVAHHPRARVVGENPLQADSRLVAAVGHHLGAGVDRLAHPHTAPVVDRHPGSPEATLSSALRIGQSAMASDPSAIASVSR